MSIGASSCVLAPSLILKRSHPLVGSKLERHGLCYVIQVIVWQDGSAHCNTTQCRAFDDQWVTIDEHLLGLAGRAKASQKRSDNRRAGALLSAVSWLRAALAVRERGCGWLAALPPSSVAPPHAGPTFFSAWQPWSGSCGGTQKL